MELVCEDGGGRIDAWLAGALEDISRSGVQKLIDGGRVTVNGVRAAKSDRLKNGDHINILIPEKESAGVTAQDIKLDIIYEDDYIIVVDKPRGMVVHPGNGNRDNTLANALAFHCAAGLSDVNGAVRPGIVHRLDKDTSGLIVAAKTNGAHHTLAVEFKERRVRKIYNAIVLGHVDRDAGRIEMPVGRHETERTRMAVLPGGRSAATLFKVIKRLPCRRTWLELEILTGRTHQIRVHLERIGHPVAGDPVYGRGAHRNICPPDPESKGGENADNSGYDGCGQQFRGSGCPVIKEDVGQLLHSTILEFTHPATGTRLCFKSALPDFFPR